MSLSTRIAASFALVLLLSAPAVHAALTAPTAPAAATAEVPDRYKPTEKLYRQYCGQCHALKEARAVGFGSGDKLGPGEHAGPSFDPLIVPWQLSVLAVLGHWDGHDRIVKLMTWDEIYDVACYTQHATRDHEFMAKMPSDEFLEPGSLGSGARCGPARNSNTSAGSGTSTLRGTLNGTLNAAGRLTLRFKGKAVSSLKAGRYTITVVDQSSTSSFTLQRTGKPAVKLTGQPFVGKKTVTLTLGAGQWTFYSAPGSKSRFVVT